MVTIDNMEFTPEELEKLRIAEEAHYLDLEEAELLETNNAILKDAGPEMRKVFTDDQILELAKAEEAHYADMDMAEISSELSKPTSINTTLAETPIHPIGSDQYRFTGPAEYLRDLKAYKQELERIIAKPFEQMTKEEDLIVNRSDHITMKLKSEIKAEISSESAKPTSLSRAEQKLETFKKAKKTAVADGKRKTNLSVGTVVSEPQASVPVGNTIEAKLASIQALKNAAKTPAAGAPVAMTESQKRLEAAKARGRAMDSLDYENIDDLIGSGSFDDEIDYMDDAYRGMLNTKPVAVGPASSASITPTAVTTTSRSSTTKNIIKGVETATDLVSSKSKLNLKTGFAASTLGFTAGYIGNRRKSRR